ncbi:hypothetical protein PPYR_11892 [Photinus pyralis]|uniref:AB hydrolase-1 domain-containing protein n=1 Tax=Photinus pyralis TaxID=7054 RepID=A0A5N4ACJ8_PHOPY|nr:probable serine hydrolase [Photinus pyralis]XP_031351140.1 probable serine hydrolase [Photinus pyralis]KAB0795053.1 hypothetical protein PPYR_11892 [Photinus pyralis]
MSQSQINGFQSQANSHTGAEFEEITIDVPWGYIAGKWWGSKTIQPVLAIHGWQDNAGTFDTLIPLVMDRNTSFLCIDLPGHGLSSQCPPGHHYSAWDFVLTVRRIVKRFKWNNIKILGHSMGAAIAFVYAAIFPNDLDGYVAIDMISSVPRETDENFDSIKLSLDRFLQYDGFNWENSMSYEYDDIVQLLMTVYSNSLTTESAKILLKRGAKQTKDHRFQFRRDACVIVDNMASYFTFNTILTFSSRIKCDVMYIQAESGLMLHKSEQHDAIVESIRQSARRFEHCTVPGTHHVHLNNPESVCNIIKSFWKTCR